MRFLSLGLLALLGTAMARKRVLSLTHEDGPMASLASVPDFQHCKVTKHVGSLNAFAKHVASGRLRGPCRYLMTRSHTGDLKKYLGDKKRGKKKFTKVLVNLRAPPKIVTYIDSIHIYQEGIGADCKSFRISPLRKNKKKTPVYFTAVKAAADDLPSWEIGHGNQIQGGEYQLDIPSACLIDPTTLVINTTHVYEEVASRVYPIKGYLKSIGLHSACVLNKTEAPVDTYAEYFHLVKGLPMDCQYEYERDYTWEVPTSHILVKNNVTTVVAQIALHEPMLADQAREVVAFELEDLKGTACKSAEVYARKKQPDQEPDVPIEDLELINHILYADIPPELADMTYDFHFVLPEGCEIRRPLMKITVADFRNDDTTEEDGFDIADFDDYEEEI